MKTLHLCLALNLSGPISIATPQSVIDLSKKRITEAFAQNHGILLSFDSSICKNQSQYELRSYGIHIKQDPQILESDFDVSFQELLEGRKIFPSIRDDFEENQQEYASHSQSDKTSEKNISKKIWIGVGLGLLSLAAVQYQNGRSNKSTAAMTQVKNFR